MHIGEWSVDPATHQIERAGQTVTLEARTMRLLVCLAQRAGEIVSFDELMDQVWSGTVVTQDSVYQAVASLRRLLADNPRKPEYIVTVPRRGYRLVAKVVVEAGGFAGGRSDAASAGAAMVGHTAPAGATSASPTSASVASAGVASAGVASAIAASSSAPATAPQATTPPKPASATRRWRYAFLLGASALVAAILAFVFIGHPRPHSVAVLPFLDLTSQAMDEEYFADGMTEELITRLSKIPTFEVPPPTASFYFKDKRLALSAIAKELNVAYVVDGSIRRSGQTLRVTTRLVRADDGFVIWSEVYDRHSADLLEVQDDIAEHVAQAIEETTSKSGFGKLSFH